MKRHHEKSLAPNPMVILREDFDDWAILFDADTGKGYSLNPTAVFIWKCIENRYPSSQIVEEIKDNHTEVPVSVYQDVHNLLDKLSEHGLIGETYHAS